MAFALPGLLRQYGQIPTFWLAVFAFGLCYGAYMAETFRAGIESVDVGQREAARALGLSGRQTLWHIVLPQALRNVLPAFVNESVALLKDTSLAAVIGIEEITQRARLEVAATYDTFAVYIMVALIYLVLTLSLSQLARVLERRQVRARPDHPSPRAA
jgi:polar amino acid transport system permease protein